MFWGAAGGAVALVAVLVYLLAFSPLLATRSVDVKGTVLLTADQVKAAAAVPMGLPVLRQDTDAIASRVQSLAPVESVKVDKVLPGTVSITVTERTLVYQLVGDKDVQWVDSSGVVFNATPAGTDGVIQVKAPGADERLRRDIATVVAHLPDAVEDKVRTFEADAVDRISFTLGDKREVIWGSAEDSALKSEVLSALLTVDASVYDVSAPRNPITRK